MSCPVNLFTQSVDYFLRICLQDIPHHDHHFCGTPLGFVIFYLFLPSMRYATLGFGVQRRWRRRRRGRLLSVLSVVVGGQECPPSVNSCSGEAGSLGELCESQIFIPSILFIHVEFLIRAFGTFPPLFAFLSDLCERPFLIRAHQCNPWFLFSQFLIGAPRRLSPIEHLAFSARVPPLLRLLCSLWLFPEWPLAKHAAGSIIVYKHFFGDLLSQPERSASHH